MRTQKIIPRKYYGVKLPITPTMLHAFLLYYFNAPSWLIGVYGTLCVIVWIIVFIGIYNQEQDESLVNSTKE